ncbi:MAG: hypothetical protein AAFR67_09880, partial [Chloroflexota bacterium]
MSKQVRQYALVTMIAIVLLWIAPFANAQEIRDYAITDVRSELIEDDTVIRLTVVVENIGADAIGETDILIMVQEASALDAESRELLSDNLLPLDSGTSVTLEIPFEVTTFPADSQQVLTVSVGIDRFELANTEIAENNIQTITITIPPRAGRADSDVLFQRTTDSVIVAGQTYTLWQAGMGILGFVGVLMLFWVLSIIIRALFRSRPKFGPWQPPYGVMPMYDQNTLEGRRWSWQQHAQNGLLLAPPTNNNVHAVKLLLGAQGGPFINWDVTAMRLSQYDTYGRIARTQVFAEKKYVKRFNKVLRQRQKGNFDEGKLQKRLRPIAENMVKQFNKKVSKKTSFLPIAFDMRLAGEHGTVRIVFELYQCRDYAWYRIDQWEPMMQVVSQKMQENYTFTIHGKEQGENKREFRDRLRDDLLWLLLESIRIDAPQEASTSAPQE